MNSSAYAAARRGVRRFPPPPTMTGSRSCTGLGSAGESTSVQCAPSKPKRGPDRRRPQARDDGQLLLEAVEPLPQRRGTAGRRRRAPRRTSRCPAPSSTRPPGHGVHLRDGDGQRPGVAERRGRDQGAEPDGRGLAGQPGERDPGVGGAGQAVAAAHRQVVVGAEERAVPALLGRPGHGEQVVVGGALLGLGEHAQLHGGLTLRRGRAAVAAAGAPAGPTRPARSRRTVAVVTLAPDGRRMLRIEAATPPSPSRRSRRGSRRASAPGRSTRRCRSS